MIVSDDFEDRLVTALEPIRQMALASAIYTLFKTGLFALADTGASVRIEQVANDLNLDPERLHGFLLYAQNEGLVDYDGQEYALSDLAQSYRDFEPWYTMLVGGYMATFQSTADTLKSGSPYATRNSAEVGRGSCGISAYDALPLTHALLADGDGQVKRFLDLGCGDASYLMSLCAGGASAVGVDVDAGNVERGNRLIAEAGMEDRLQLVQASALQEVLSGEAVTRLQPDCVLAAFLLQEILEQEGRGAVVQILRHVRATYPHASFIVIEVDQRADDLQAMATGLGRSYYNPYFLLHVITNQRLVTRQDWEAIFHEAGYEIVALRHPDQHVDSTNLELGFLLRSPR